MENITLADPGAQLSIWALFLQAGWVVKLVMIGLLCASIWTWAIIFDKLVSYGRMRAALNRFEQTFWSGQSLEELYRTLADRKTTGHGGDLRRGHARVEEILREGRQVAARRCRPASTRRWTWR